MKVKVQLVYNGSSSRELTVEVKDSLKGQRLMVAIDKAVKKVGADDKAWVRWNLISIEEPKK